MTLGGVRFDFHNDLPDNPRMPANTRPYLQTDAVVLQFHDFGEFGPKGIAHQPARFLKDFIKIIRFERTLPEPHKDILLAEQFGFAA
jgi:hypothetical protein